jgi:hypothetical protein
MATWRGDPHTYDIAGGVGTVVIGVAGIIATSVALSHSQQRLAALEIAIAIVVILILTGLVLLVGGHMRVRSAKRYIQEEDRIITKMETALLALRKNLKDLPISEEAADKNIGTINKLTAEIASITNAHYSAACVADAIRGGKLRVSEPVATLDTIENGLGQSLKAHYTYEMLNEQLREISVREWLKRRRQLGYLQ